MLTKHFEIENFSLPRPLDQVENYWRKNCTMLLAKKSIISTKLFFSIFKSVLPLMPESLSNVDDANSIYINIELKSSTNTEGSGKYKKHLALLRKDFFNSDLIPKGFFEGLN